MTWHHAGKPTYQGEMAGEKPLSREQRSGEGLVRSRGARPTAVGGVSAWP